MTSISNVSIGAKLAGAAAADARHGMNEAIARLSTGRRSMYGGDAAAQAMADNIKARGMSFAVAARNAEDGLSVAQTIESAIMEIASLAQRLRELGIQQDNAALHSASDIAALSAEAVAVTDAMALIEQTTKFNGKTIIDDADTTIDIGVTDGGGTVTITSKLIVDKSDTTTATNAELSADAILADVGESLGNIAAAMTVLKARQAVAYSASANMMAAASRLQDTDFAASSANLAKFSILNQSAMAMVAQANQAQSAVLAVLQ
jgi:flagellin